MAASTDAPEMLSAILKIAGKNAPSNHWTSERLAKFKDLRVCVTSFATTQYKSDVEIAKPVVYVGLPDGSAVTPTGKIFKNPIEAMVRDGFVQPVQGTMMVTINWLRGLGLDGAKEQINDPQRRDPDPLRTEAKVGISKDNDGRYEDLFANFLYATNDHLIEGVRAGRPLSGFKKPEDYKSKKKSLEKKIKKGSMDTDDLYEALRDSEQPPYTFMRYAKPGSKYEGQPPTMFLRGPIFPRMNRRDEKAGTVGPDGVHKPSIERASGTGDYPEVVDALRSRPRDPKGESGFKLNNYRLEDIQGNPIEMSSIGAGSVAVVPFELIAKATPAGAVSLQLVLIDDKPIQVVHHVKRTETTESDSTDYMAAIAAAAATTTEPEGSPKKRPAESPEEPEAKKSKN
jgi:hypothetical protein